MADKNSIVPVILCGGAGTRLWPVSRKSYPKQFSKLIDDKSLFQSAASICSGSEFAAPMVVTGDPFRFLVVEQLAAIETLPTKVLVEPESRNTAASVLAAALSLLEEDSDCLMLVMPSDHVIAEPDRFQNAVIAAAPTAWDGRLVTFGIHPTRPETGYGYLELAKGANGVGDAVPFADQLRADHRVSWIRNLRLARQRALYLISQPRAPHCPMPMTFRLRGNRRRLRISMSHALVED